jgi:hypothetical protein
MIYQAHLNSNILGSAEDIQVKYPKNLMAAVLEEQARILAQGMHTDPEMAALGAQEHEVLEALESGHHDEHPYWMLAFQQGRKNPLEVIKGRDKNAIMLACREHIRDVGSPQLQGQSRSQRVAYPEPSLSGSRSEMDPHTEP